MATFLYLYACKNEQKNHFIKFGTEPNSNQKSVFFAHDFFNPMGVEPG